MNLSDFSIWVAIFFLICADISLAQYSYITWDDMKVDFSSLSLKDERSSTSQRVIVVDQKGKGDSITVQGAVDKVPFHNSRRVIIYIHPGTYREKVHIPASKPFISLVGDQNQTARTIITGHDKASDTDQFGSKLGTSRTATVTVESDYFCATGITIENTIVPEPEGVGMQAVALRLTGDRAVLYRVRILGSQDTLLDDAGSHYFYQCYIQGSVDFICGNARSLYKNCTLDSVAKGYGAIAAQHRNSVYQDTGFSFVNCKISGSGRVFLGRAWGEYSRVIYSKCDIDGIIDPKGWTDWNLPSRRQHAVFGEYECRGNGANRAGRVPWSKSLNESEAEPFLDVKFIGGQQWLRL
ncbi:PREDICTED: pectinesterase QRT1 [Nicotiana attenuata]|uniref:pectinesterase n=1 Tax=Nicotiana attenuata TaxID=49451 RepID=A0A1J6IW37_NICAT|nr:PREDICTED: pectinesterase QRT1 [Nicotiana attenuata]OIT08484.1 pectinesterase qrt1 [Nicotiana attenuata]